MTLVYLVVAWILGILAASQAGGAAGLWLALGAASMVAAIVLRKSRRDRLALACLCLFAVGAARFSFAQRPLAENHVAQRIGRGALTLTGIIDTPPDPRDTHVNLSLSAQFAQQGTATEAVSGRVLVQAPRGTDARYGDRVQVTGSLLLPPTYDDFSYRDYLAHRDIHAVMVATAVEVVGRGGQPWLRAIYALRERSVTTIKEVLPSPQAPLLAGILLGDESGIPDDVREAFNRTGAAHIIAISGANIAILLRALMGMLTPLAGRRRAIWLASGCIAVYVILVGGDPAVVRAALMGMLALGAAQTGRRAHGLTSLAFVVWVMSLWNPSVLWDIGFQLSVAATAGLVLFTDDLTALFTRLLGRVFPAPTVTRLVAWLSEPLVVSVAAQIATTPLIVFYFGRLSIVSLLASLLVVPVQPYIMIVGWIALAAALVVPALGEVLAWVVWVPLTYTLRVVEVLAGFSWAAVGMRLSADVVWAISVALLGLGMIRIMHPDDRAALGRRLRQALPASAAGGAAAIIALLVWQTALRQPDGRLHVWFFDVGGGDAALIETPRGAQILIGGGKSPTRLQAALGRALPFQDRELDALILSRQEPDEMASLAALFDRYSARAVLAAAPARGDAEAVELWRRLALPSPLQLQPGQVIATDDGVRIEALVPEAAEAGGLRVTYRDASFLFGYGFSAEDEMALLASGYDLRSTVLQLAGGGSDRANTARFLAAVNPQVVIAAADAGSRAALPHPAVVERLERNGLSPRIYQMDRNGTLELITDGTTLEVRISR